MESEVAGGEGHAVHGGRDTLETDNPQPGECEENHAIGEPHPAPACLTHMLPVQSEHLWY